LNYFRHTIYLLFAAAAIGLPAASGVSCGNSPSRHENTAAQNNSPRQPSADTLALVEGLRLFEQAEYALAREQFTESARSASTYIRAESQLYLNALEMELGNYDAAHAHLERYHAETVRLLRTAADSSARMEEQAARLRRQYDVFVAGMVVVTLIVVGTALFFLRRGRQPKNYPQSAAPAPETAPETTPETAPDHDISDWLRYSADAEAFKQTAVWNEIESLAAQKPSREARVLSLARQEVLDVELAMRFSDFAARLRAEYPALTAGDVKLCCLSLMPLSTFARALCFGSVESNIIKQRKHTIKKKLGGTPRDRALFEFIFEQRG
jgi:hypothetical protein